MRQRRVNVKTKTMAVASVVVAVVATAVSTLMAVAETTVEAMDEESKLSSAAAALKARVDELKAHRSRAERRVGSVEARLVQLGAAGSGGGGADGGVEG